MYEYDKRVVMTLDAGGTNFVFSAIQGCREVVEPICLPAVSDNLLHCLSVLVKGFNAVKELLPVEPVAISFAFPGPADYKHGVIGDLPNFPVFRGGVALGPYLQEQFNLPVFINNDGNLFAYGEALVGALPYVNGLLRKNGCNKRFRTLIGITLGTGFGAGVVINNELLTGDNGCGGDIWNFRNGLLHDKISEESVSVRAVKRVYSELSGDMNEGLTPKDIYDIAEGDKPGDREAAAKSFETLGKATGDAIAYILTVIDGIVVIGGGLSGAAKYIMPSLMHELRGSLSTFSGEIFSRLQMDVFNLDDVDDLKVFSSYKPSEIQVFGTDKRVVYDLNKYVGVLQTRLTASKAISLGAYVFALNELDRVN